MTCPAGVTRTIPPAATSPSAPPAGPARCGPGAPPPSPGGSSTCTPWTGCCAPPAREWAADAGLREDYAQHRPNVERAIAQVATWRAAGSSSATAAATRNHAWLKRRTAALNLRNLVGRGLTRRDGAWVLAT